MPDQTLAQLVRAKYPGAYDKLSDQQLEAAVSAKYPGTYDSVPRTPIATEPARTPGRPAGPATIGEMTDEKWAKLSAGEKMQNILQWAGHVITGATLMDRSAIDNPGTTLALAAIPAAGVAARAIPPSVKPAIANAALSTAAKIGIPTTANAGAKFQRVMSAAGNQSVDISAPGESALRIYELSERGASMPKAVRDFLKRVTDPEKGPLVYREARDFASNISRLSVNEYQRLSPVVLKEIHALRVSLNKAVGQAAGAAGKGEEYASAMKEYAQASRLNDAGKTIRDYAMKYAGPATVAGLAYKRVSGLLSGEE